MSPRPADEWRANNSSGRRQSSGLFGLARIVPPSLLGFAITNGFTFGLDPAILAGLHGGLRLRKGRPREPAPIGIEFEHAAGGGGSRAAGRIPALHRRCENQTAADNGRPRGLCGAGLFQTGELTDGERGENWGDRAR